VVRDFDPLVGQRAAVHGVLAPGPDPARRRVTASPNTAGVWLAALQRVRELDPEARTYTMLFDPASHAERVEVSRVGRWIRMSAFLTLEGARFPLFLSCGVTKDRDGG
jgi:hypothetical protein